MANLIGSLRLISTFDWSEFFESVSLVEQVLQRDPAGVYGRMDFRSRDRYRHAVEELAEPTGEGQLPRRAQERRTRAAGRRAHARTRASAHVGYLPDWRRPPAVRAERRLEPDAGAAHPAAVLPLRHAGLSRHDRLGTALLVGVGASPTPRGTAGAARCCS